MAYVWMKNGKQFKNPLEYNNRKIINPSDTFLLNAGYQKVDIPTINEKTIVETRDQLPTPNQYYVGKTYLSIEDKGIYICAKEDNNYVWNKIPLSAENVLEVFSEFPTPSETYLNKIYMYVGYSTSEYQLGKLYTCIYNEDEHEYQWVEFASTETINTVSDIVCFPAVQTGVLLQWSDPVDNNWDKTVIVRKQGSAPSSPSDGTVVLTNTIRDQYKNNPYLDSGIDYTNYTWYYRWFTYSYGGIINDDEQSIKESILSWKTIKQLAENNNVDFRDYFNLGDNISTYNGIITNYNDIITHIPENAKPTDFYWHIVDINQHNMRLLASRAYINSTTLTSGYSMLPYDIAQKSYISGVSTPWDNVSEFCIMPKVVIEEDWPELYKFNEIPFYLITTPEYQDGSMVFDKNRIWRTINTLYEIHFDVSSNTWVIYNTYTKQIEVNLSDTGNSPTRGIYNYSIFYTTEDNLYNDDLAKDHEEEYQINAEIEINNMTYYRLFDDGYTINKVYHPFDGSNYLIRNFITPSDGLTTYKNCAIDQYLNTSGDGGLWYQPQSLFSIARAWTNEKPGFMKEFDQDFIDGLANTTIEVIPGYYPLNNTHITRKFFIPSLKELNCTQTTLSSAADLDYPLQFYIDHPTNTYKIKQEYFSNPIAGYQAIRYYTRNSGYDNKIYRVIVNGNAATTPTVTNNTWIIPECTVGLTDDISRGLMYESQILAAHGSATISGDMNGITLYFECIGIPNWVSLSIPNNEVVINNDYIHNIIWNEEEQEEYSDELISNLPFNQNQKNTVILTVYKHICMIYVNGQKFTSNSSNQIPLTFTNLSTNNQIQNVKIWNRDLSNYEKQLLEDTPSLATITITEPVINVLTERDGEEIHIGTYDLNSICSVSPSSYGLSYAITSSDHPNATHINNGVFSLDYIVNETGTAIVTVTTTPVASASGTITVYYESVDGCLTEDTLITMLDGTQKQIKDVKIGETVKSINQTTGEYEMGIVRYNRGLSNRTYDNYDLWTFENGTTIKTMTGHRLYNVEKKAYVYLNEWNIGDSVLFANGTTSKLVSHENIKQNVVLYSLIIDQQTYIANGMLTGTRRAKPITPFPQYNGIIEEN